MTAKGQHGTCEIELAATSEAVQVSGFWDMVYLRFRVQGLGCRVYREMALAFY